jgi:hypothetical protein
LLLTGKWLKLKYFRLKFLGQTAKENWSFGIWK